MGWEHQDRPFGNAVPLDHQVFVCLPTIQEQLLTTTSKFAVVAATSKALLLILLLLLLVCAVLIDVIMFDVVIKQPPSCPQGCIQPLV